MKRLLRNKANFEILEGFLSELLRRDITIKHIGESEGNKTDSDDKTNIVDIFVEADGNELIIIELQYDSEYDYFQRMLYGASKSILEHISEGDPFYNVRKIYSISILHFDLGTGDDYVYHGTTNFKGLHTKDELILSEDQKKVYVKNSIPEIFPEYYIIKVRKFKEEIKDALDEWIYYFKTSKIKDDFKARGMNKVREALAYENLTDAERQQYWREDKATRVRDSELHTKFVEGKVEGEAIAEKKAEEKVKVAETKAKNAEEKAKAAEENAKAAEEKAKNAEENTNKKAIKNALNAGYSIEIMQTFTGLSIEDIKKIIEAINQK